MLDNNVGKNWVCELLMRTLIALMIGCLLFCGCQSPRASVDLREYKVVEKDLYQGQLEREINTLASNGWVLVTVSIASQGETAVPKGFIVVSRPKSERSR